MVLWENVFGVFSGMNNEVGVFCWTGFLFVYEPNQRLFLVIE